MSQIHFGLTNTQLCYEGTIENLVKELKNSSEFQLKSDVLEHLQNTWRQKLKNTGVCYPKTPIINSFLQKNVNKTVIKGQNMINSNINFIDTHYPEKQTQINQTYPEINKSHSLNKEIVQKSQNQIENNEIKSEQTTKKSIETQKMPLQQQAQTQNHIKKQINNKIEIQLSSQVIKHSDIKNNEDEGDDDDDDEELFPSTKNEQQGQYKTKNEVIDYKDYQQNKISLEDNQQIIQQEKTQLDIQQNNLKKINEIKNDEKEEYLSDLSSSEDYKNNRNVIKNQFFGYYERVHRQRDKWRVQMKEMIGRVNDKEYIFNSLNGEFIFETKN